MDNSIGLLIFSVLLGVFIYVIVMTKSLKEELTVRLEKTVKETVKKEIDKEIQNIKTTLPIIIKSQTKNLLSDKMKKFTPILNILK